MSGIIGRSKSPSVVDFIIRPLGNFSFMVFVVGRTLFRCADTAKKFTVNPESATAEFSSFVSFFFVVGAK